MLLRGSPSPCLWSAWTYAACASTPSGDALCCWSCHLPMTAAKFQKLLHSRPSCPHVSLDWAFPYPWPQKGEKVPQHSKKSPPPSPPTPTPRLPNRPFKGVGREGTIAQAPPPSRLLSTLLHEVGGEGGEGAREEMRVPQQWSCETTGSRSSQFPLLPQTRQSSGPSAGEVEEVGSQRPGAEGPTPAPGPCEDCAGPSPTR